jgi:Tol biopolymer transport system component
MLAAPWGFFDSVIYEQIWSVSYPGGEAYKVTADLSNYNTALNLSNNLSSLLSIEYRQTMNIWAAPANDLTQSKQITFGSFGKNDGFTGLAWLFDGKILFTSTTFGNQVISVMHADGGDVKQLTSPGYVDAGPTISDDGRYIFFHSHRSGLFEIWRMDVDGKNMVQLTKGGDNYQPYASPDGKWVYY